MQSRRLNKAEFVLKVAIMKNHVPEPFSRLGSEANVRDSDSFVYYKKKM